MGKPVTDQDERYNIVCLGCNNIWEPRVKSPLWWKAKARANSGKLDALHVTVEECGCVPGLQEPDAPYRVLGYDDEGYEFDIPFHAPVPAMKKFRELSNGMNTVFISGVSPAVQVRLSPL